MLNFVRSQLYDRLNGFSGGELPVADTMLHIPDVLWRCWSVMVGLAQL